MAEKKRYIYDGYGGFNPEYGLLEKGKELYLTDIEAAPFGKSVRLAESGNVNKVKLRDNVKVKTGG